SKGVNPCSGEWVRASWSKLYPPIPPIPKIDRKTSQSGRRAPVHMSTRRRYAFGLPRHSGCHHLRFSLTQMARQALDRRLLCSLLLAAPNPRDAVAACHVQHHVVGSIRGPCLALASAPHHLPWLRRCDGARHTRRRRRTTFVARSVAEVSGWSALWP